MSERREEEGSACLCSAAGVGGGSPGHEVPLEGPVVVQASVVPESSLLQDPRSPPQGVFLLFQRLPTPQLDTHIHTHTHTKHTLSSEHTYKNIFSCSLAQHPEFL